MVAPLYYDVAADAYPAFCLVAIDRQVPQRAVAKAHSVPLSWPDDPAERLPAGCDDVVLRATGDRAAGRKTNLVSALEICIQPDLRGSGLSAVMLDAMRRNAARLGYRSLVAPVRPNGKHAHPQVPMTEYATSWRSDLQTGRCDVRWTAVPLGIRFRILECERRRGANVAGN